MNGGWSLTAQEADQVVVGRDQPLHERAGDENRTRVLSLGS